MLVLVLVLVLVRRQHQETRRRSIVHRLLNRKGDGVTWIEQAKLLDAVGSINHLQHQQQRLQDQLLLKEQEISSLSMALVTSSVSRSRTHRRMRFDLGVGAQAEVKLLEEQQVGAPADVAVRPLHSPRPDGADTSTMEVCVTVLCSYLVATLVLLTHWCGRRVADAVADAV